MRAIAVSGDSGVNRSVSQLRFEQAPRNES
jgi:hypothetical protein